MNKQISPDVLFKSMCETTVNVMNYYTSFISVPALAQQFETTKYQIRKTMKELVFNSLVRSGYECCCSECDDQYFIVRGFCVTKKGEQTQVYKNAYEQETKNIKECFGV